MKQVIVFPRGQLTADDRAELNDAGFVAVEADDPKAVVVHLPGVPLATGDDLTMAAIAGVTAPIQYNRADVMVTELQRRLKAKEASRAA